MVAQVAAGELRWERRGAVLVLALQFQPGTAAILGIAVAIGVGALLPVPGGVDAQHDVTDPHAHRDA